MGNGRVHGAVEASNTTHRDILGLVHFASCAVLVHRSSEPTGCAGYDFVDETARANRDLAEKVGLEAKPTEGDEQPNEVATLDADI